MSDSLTDDSNVAIVYYEFNFVILTIQQSKLIGVNLFAFICCCYSCNCTKH